MSRIISGEGTPEEDWTKWLESQIFPSCSLLEIIQDSRRVVIVAPHPDDEVLGTAGIIQCSDALNLPCTIISVTDGEASHPQSPLWPPEVLRQTRIQESTQALGLLRPSTQVVRLGIPDGDVAKNKPWIFAALQKILHPSDAVFCTWRYDGHPDHEATGKICTDVTNKIGCKCLEIPIWAWHWASPGDSRVPWQRAVILPLTPTQLALKQQALACFRSQLQPDASTGKAAILPQWAIRRLIRPFELVFQ